MPKREKPVSESLDQIIWTFIAVTVGTLALGALYCWRTGMWPW